MEPTVAIHQQVRFAAALAGLLLARYLAMATSRV
jgi:hypothetical protein